MANKIVRVKMPVPEKKPESLPETTSGLELSYIENLLKNLDLVGEPDTNYTIRDPSDIEDIKYITTYPSNKKSKKEDDAIIVNYSNLYNTDEYKQYK